MLNHFVGALIVFLCCHAAKTSENHEASCFEQRLSETHIALDLDKTLIQRVNRSGVRTGDYTFSTISENNTPYVYVVFNEVPYLMSYLEKKGVYIDIFSAGNSARNVIAYNEIMKFTAAIFGCPLFEMKQRFAKKTRVYSSHHLSRHAISMPNGLTVQQNKKDLTVIRRGGSGQDPVAAADVILADDDRSYVVEVSQKCFIPLCLVFSAFPAHENANFNDFPYCSAAINKQIHVSDFNVRYIMGVLQQCFFIMSASNARIRLSLESFYAAQNIINNTQGHQDHVLGVLKCGTDVKNELVQMFLEESFSAS